MAVMPVLGLAGLHVGKLQVRGFCVQNPYHKRWIGVFVGTWPIHAPGAPCCLQFGSDAKDQINQKMRWTADFSLLIVGPLILGFAHAHTQYTHYIHTHTLYTHSIHTHNIHALYTHTQFSHYIYIHTLYIHTIYTIYTLYIHTYTIYTLYTHYIHIIYTLYTHYIHIIYTFYTH